MNTDILKDNDSIVFQAQIENNKGEELKKIADVMNPKVNHSMGI